jgi:hypothetical protein
MGESMLLLLLLRTVLLLQLLQLPLLLQLQISANMCSNAAAWLRFYMVAGFQ